ncbi:MAG: hypothetical protein JF606_12350, partial [Burkholderiales bacterium]|nr:hypothetical protein [Burkholderiales bacterium]
MTKPIGSAPASTPPTLPPATPSGTSGTGPSRPVGGPPDLGRAPALPAGARTAGASTAGRARLPAQAQPSSSSQAGASSSAPTARAPSAQLADVAQQLAGLELERKALSAQIDQAKEARQAAADRAPSARGNTKLRKLQDRVDQSAKELLRLTVSRAEQLGQLERAERLLASCERSQKALSLTEASGSRSEPVTTSPAPTLDPSQAVRPSVPPASRMSAEEVAARERVQELRQTSEAVKIEQARAKEAVADCRAEVHRLKADAESILQPRNYVGMMDSAAINGQNNYLRFWDLPDIDLRPARGATDTRYARYLEHFTEVGDDGARRVKQAFLDAPRAGFEVFSAHFCAMTPNMVIDSFLNNVLNGTHPAMERNRDLITAALRNGGEGLEDAVRRQVIAGFDYSMHLIEGLANRGERPGELLSGPRRQRIRGSSTVSRPEIIEAAARGRQLVQLQALPAHRANIIDGGVHQACVLLRGVAADFTAASGQLAQAQARLDETMGVQRSVIRRGVYVAGQLREVHEELDRLAGERQKRLAAEAKDDTKPSAAAIPQTVTAASSSTDSEGRRLKLR